MSASFDPRLYLELEPFQRLRDLNWRLCAISEHMSSVIMSGIDSKGGIDSSAGIGSRVGIDSNQRMGSTE